MAKRKKQNYFDAKSLGLPSIKRYLQDHGFEVEALKQQWRHVHGKLWKNETPYFFKLASTRGIGKRTRNETFWNKQLESRKRSLAKHGIVIPSIYKTGRLKGLFYYLADFHSGALLASGNPPRSRGLKDKISLMAKGSVGLTKIRGLTFPADALFKKLIHPELRYLKAVAAWHRLAKRDDLVELLEIANTLETLYLPSIGHGDLTPWHMLDAGKKLVVIDAEHASSFYPRYYDIAYCYHRMYTVLGRYDLCELYLSKVIKSLSASARVDFKKRFPPVLASRIIGGFGDIEVFRLEKKYQLHHRRLKRKFLAGKLL